MFINYNSQFVFDHRQSNTYVFRIAPVFLASIA